MLIVTTEASGVDKYSQEMAVRLGVKEVSTRRYLSFPDACRLSWVIRNEPDIVHLPNQNFARFALLRRNPYIVTVHDLIRFFFGFDHETLTERLWLRLDTWGIRRASHLIVPSHHTKGDLISYLKIPEDRISVIYNGLDHNVFKPVSAQTGYEPYILYVGSERPRKNLGRLLEAFALLKKEFPELKLVKVGSRGRSERYRRNTLSRAISLGIAEDVVFVDHVSDEELAGYYSAAALLVYPSLYEGFGLPPLEAMACGCPVVASNTSSLPEVIGDAGIMVDPCDVPALAQAMRRVLSDSRLRGELVEKGLKRAQRFSWDRAAEQTWEVYRKVAAGQTREVYWKGRRVRQPDESAQRY